jgi:hypothetical protein
MKRTFYYHAYGSWGEAYYSYMDTFETKPTLDEFFQSMHKATGVIMKNHGIEQTVVRHIPHLEVQNWIEIGRFKESDFIQINLKKDAK